MCFTWFVYSVNAIAASCAKGPAESVGEDDRDRSDAEDVERAEFGQTIHHVVFHNPRGPGSRTYAGVAT